MEESRRSKKKKKMIQPSSSRRETTPENRLLPSKNPIGCMSGILHLLSRHHSRRRILSARKEKIETLPPPDPTEIKTAMPDPKPSGEADSLSRRSPTLPSEIRRSNGCFDRGDSPRRPPALVARLMGLEDPPPPEQQQKPPPAAGISPESAEEKRRKLLGALERCDEDLRALKRIIDAVRTAEKIRVRGGGDSPTKCTDGSGDQPSPVSVLDGLSSPGFQASENEDVEKKAAWSSVEVSCNLPRRITIEGIRRPPSDHKRILKDHPNPSDSSSAAAKSFAGGRWRWRWRRSHAMEESVIQVEEDAACEERREVLRVGVDLADHVVGDLVDQLVVELAESCSKLSLQTVRYCKRKLCF